MSTTTLSAVLWAFANSIWQSAVIAALAWAVLGAARRASAALRCIVWSGVLVAVALLPALDIAMPASVVRVAAAPSALDVPAQHTASTTTWAAASRSVVAAPRRTDASHPTLPDHSTVIWTTRSASDIPSTASAIRSSSPNPLPVLAASTAAGIAAIGRYSPVFAWLWAAISALLLLRLGVGLHRLRAIKRGMAPIASDRLERRLSAVRRSVCVGSTDAVDSPCVIGYRRPVVALPTSLATSLDGDDLDRVLAHELGHVRRFDDWSNLAAQVLRAVWFANPVVHFAAHRLDVDREIACDDLVADDREGRLEYAKCLTEIARRSSLRADLVPAVGIFPDRKQIIIRIEQLLERKHAGSGRLGAIPVIAALALGLILALLVRHQVPAMALALPAPAAAPTAAPTAAPAATVAPAAPTVSATTAPAAAAIPVPAKPVVNAKTPALPAATDARNAAALQTMAARLRALAERDALRSTTHVHMHLERALAMRAQHLSVSARAMALAQRFATQSSSTAMAELQRAVAEAGAHASMAAIGSDRSDSLNSFLDALQAAGYKNVSVDDLIRLGNAGVTTAYLRALHASAIAPMSIDKLISAANAGVSPDYIAQMGKAGFGHSSIDTLIAMANAGVTPEFVQAVERAGYTGASPDAIVAMANAGVSTSFIAGMAKAGYSRMSVDTLVALANAGVSPSYVAGLAAEGYAGISTDDLIRLMNAGVTPSLIRSLREHGFMASGNPSVDTLIKLANAGF